MTLSQAIGVIMGANIGTTLLLLLSDLISMNIHYQLWHSERF